MNMEILERFVSKRNQVFLVRLHEGDDSRLAVLKEYAPANKKCLDAEYDNILMLQSNGIPVPGIIHRSSGSLLLEYLEGPLISDLAERLDTGAWIDELALWMARLHSLKGENGSLLKKDVNLRNFIFCSGRIYGLDFEQTGFGDPETDLGNICFFLLTNTPSFGREKHILMRRFLQSYESYSGTKISNMGGYLLKSRAEAKLRRQPSK